MLEIAQKNLNDGVEEKWITESERRMYQYAIDNELITPVGDMCEWGEDDLSHKDNNAWILYKDPSKINMEKYNKENNTTYEYWFQMPEKEQNKIDIYGDSPRIGGYPEIIIRSYEQMMEFMKTGHTDEEGKLHMFCYEPEDYDRIIEKLQRFWNNYPDGIITFG